MSAPEPHHPLPMDDRGNRSLKFQAMGTHCSIRFRGPNEDNALEFAAETLRWVSHFESKFSRYRADSLLSSINRSAGKEWVKVDAETEHLFDLVDSLHERTHGVLDPTSLPLLQLWDWRNAQIPSAHEIQECMQLIGWKHVLRKPGWIFLPKSGMGLDFGGFGKEYAVDQVAALARRFGIQDALIDFGRDLFAIGGNGLHPFWHVGIEDGMKPGECWGGLAISDQGVSASGNYHRSFEHQGQRYGHILDPRTGKPVDNQLVAVTVVAPSCLEAGIYSTAIFVLGASEGLHLASLARQVEACAQSPHGIETTRRFNRLLVRPA